MLYYIISVVIPQNKVIPYHIDNTFYKHKNAGKPKPAVCCCSNTYTEWPCGCAKYSNRSPSARRFYIQK